MCLLIHETEIAGLNLITDEHLILPKSMKKYQENVPNV